MPVVIACFLHPKTAYWYSNSMLLAQPKCQRTPVTVMFVQMFALCPSNQSDSQRLIDVTDSVQTLETGFYSP